MLKSFLKIKTMQFWKLLKRYQQSAGDLGLKQSRSKAPRKELETALML